MPWSTRELRCDPIVPLPFGAGSFFAAGPIPPVYGTKGSAVPWNAITGTRQEGRHPEVASIPATVATAAILLASLQASADAMNAPFEYPATYTLWLLTHRVLSRWPMSAIRNFWSELPGVVTQCWTGSFTWGVTVMKPFVAP